MRGTVGHMRALVVLAVAIAPACSVGSPFPTPFASDREVGRYVMAEMLLEQEVPQGLQPAGAECDRGVHPGGGDVALYTVTLDGCVLTYGVALTSDHQLVSRIR